MHALKFIKSHKSATYSHFLTYKRCYELVYIKVITLFGIELLGNVIVGKRYCKCVYRGVFKAYSVFVVN